MSDAADGTSVAAAAMAARARADDDVLERSLARLRRVGELRDLVADLPDADAHPIIRALREVGRREGFDIDVGHALTVAGIRDLPGVARSLGLNMRQVRLRAGWQDGAVSTFLGFRTPSEPGREPTPVVLTPRSGRTPATIWDPLTEQSEDLVDQSLVPIAFEFYAPIQPAGELSYDQIVSFTFAHSRREIFTTLILALGVGLLGLLTPVVTNHVFGTLVPEDETTLVWASGGALVLAAIVVWGFTVVQGFAVTRLTLRAEQRFQPAVWARVLSLPASFFRRYSSGELAGRVLGADRIRQTVSTTNVGIALSAVFSLVQLVLMYTYSVQLGLAGTVLIVLTALGTWGFARRLVAQTTDIIDQHRRNNAHISDLLEGLSVIRTAAAEKRFFALHAELVRRKTVLQAQQQQTAIALQAFYVGVIALTPAVFIVIVAQWGWNDSSGISDISAPTYLAFTTAFGIVMTAMLSLSGLIQPLATGPATLASMKPIFEAEPEYDPFRTHPGRLQGRIELSDVSFRYSAESRWVANGLSIVAEPGEFIALVGPSGVGKSTVLRLLLGFERPAHGSVLYDEHNLNEVDLAAVRSQLGVVLQDAQTMGGSILDTIVGARPLTEEDAWAALDAAGLGDDVRAMSMQLHTIVTADGTSLSGGQLQRLSIARAVVVRPQVLLLDEATSHLDDATQAVVTDSIARLGMTRLAIAHRLSTIRAADRIYMLGDGRVVEQGTFDELMDLDGAFAALARRQLT